jgi:hypothetical protein
LRTAVKPWHVQMGWTMRPTARAMVLAPRIGANETTVFCIYV